MNQTPNSNFEIENPLKPPPPPAPPDDSDSETLSHFTKYLFYFTLTAILCGFTLGLTFSSPPLIINTLDQITLLSIFALTHYSLTQAQKHDRLTYPYGRSRLELISALTIHIKIIFSAMHFLSTLTTAALT